MINIGNKEINSIYCGKNAVYGVYAGQKKIWPIGSTQRKYLISFYSQDPNAVYDMDNPDGGTYDNEFFQEIYEKSPLNDKIFINKVSNGYDPNTYEIQDWEYSAFTRHISDNEVKVVISVIAYGEVENVGECWYRAEMSKMFDNQADAEAYVLIVHREGVTDFTGFEMGAHKDVVLKEGNQPYTDIPFTRCVWPPTDPTIDSYNWITDAYDQLPKYEPHTISNDEWLTGTITDSQGQEFSAVFKKEYDDESEIDFNLTMLNGMEVDPTAPLFFAIYYMTDGDKWQIMFNRNGQYVGNYDANTTGRNTKNFNFTIDVGGMTMNFNLTRTNVEPN